MTLEEQLLTSDDNPSAQVNLMNVLLMRQAEKFLICWRESGM